VEQGVMTTTLDKAVSWARGNSFFPAHLRSGLLRDRDDVDRRHAPGHRRFGFEAFRASPRQSDLILLPVGCPSRWLRSSGASGTRCWSPSSRSRWRLLLLDGVFNTTRCAQRQVHADRRARAGLPAPPRGAGPRDPAPAREGPEQRKVGWRERYDAVGTEEILSPTGRDPHEAQTDLDTADISVFKHGDTAGA